MSKSLRVVAGQAARPSLKAAFYGFENRLGALCWHLSNIHEDEDADTANLSRVFHHIAESVRREEREIDDIWQGTLDHERGGRCVVTLGKAVIREVISIYGSMQVQIWIGAIFKGNGGGR